MNPPAKFALPGNSFSVWTHPERVAVVPAPRLTLPGNQFSVWTRPIRVEAPAASNAPAKTTAPSSGNTSLSWLSKAALWLVPLLLALWYLDHRQARKDFRKLQDEKKTEMTTKHQLYERNVVLAKQQAHQAAALTELENKTLNASKERDGAKEALAKSEETLKARQLEAESASTKLKSVTDQFEKLRKELRDKETAMTKSVDILQTENTRLKQALSQLEVDMKSALAKLELERATALKDAAAAQAALAELKAK
jgi:hypothetical protein